MEMLDVLKTHPILWLTVAGVFGLMIGSFLNVVIYRLPKMMQAEWRLQCHEFLEIEYQETEKPINLLLPASHCPHCGVSIPFYRNIPVLSYVLQKGRCANCGEKISIRYPLVEILTASLTMAVAYRFGVSWVALTGMLLSWVLITLALIDYDTQLLPDSLTLPMIWLGLGFSLIPLFVNSTDSIIGAISGYMLLWTVYHVFKIVTGKEGMGFGDFKLLSMLGAWLGWKMVPVIILFSSFAGAFIGILLMVFKGHNKEKPIPFGPYLAIAGWFSLIYGHSILDGYFSFSLQ